MTTVVGVILVIIGVVALGAGVGGGIAAMFKDIKKRAEEGKDFGAIELPTEFIKALTEFTKALTAAPVWLALVIIGILLVIVGGTML